MPRNKEVKLAPVEEKAMVVTLKPDGNMKIDKITLQDGYIVAREVFADDMADICLDKLNRHYRFQLLSGDRS